MPEYQNPSQGPGGDKQLFVMFAVMFVIIALFQVFANKKPPSDLGEHKAQPQQASNTAQNTPATPTQTAPAQRPEAANKPTPTPAQTQRPAPQKQASAEQQIVVENSQYRITFTNKGAQVTSWVLKRFDDEKGHPLDLVNARAAEQYGYPLSLFSYDEGLRNKLNSALYVASTNGPLKAPATLTFEYSDGTTVARKTLSFEPDTYVVKIETSVTNAGQAIQAWPQWPAGFGDQAAASAYAASRIDWMNADGVERKQPKEISGGNTVRGPFFWAGPTDQYFAAVFLPDRPDKAAMVTLHNTIEANPSEPDPEKRKKDVYQVLGAAVGDVEGATSERLFVGPKNLEILNSVQAYASPAEQVGKPDGPTLEATVDFGKWLGFIAKPLFIWLRWTHEHWVSNWGWAIIVLTLIITVVLFPLRYTGLKMAIKQKKAEPEVKAINEKYARMKLTLTDPRQRDKQQEIQAVHNKHGINPVAGCLPTVIQLPFLYAFYQMLGVAVELRHAHWLWLHDLSSADPTHIIPILIIVSMFFMQKITPMGGVDAAQAKMMQYTMPLMIGWFSWFLPAGLGIYWLFSNVIGVVQQLGFNQLPFAREVLRPAPVDTRSGRRRK